MWEEELGSQFPTEEVQMANEDVETCSASRTTNAHTGGLAGPTAAI